MWEDDGGIIPARAGFTHRSRPSSPNYGDHPRSRGVYVESVDSTHPIWGSSPLARGLPPCDRNHSSFRGIIPARAGFTNSIISNSKENTDHPRSRGVYYVEREVDAYEVGSSPLARGLHAESRHEVQGFRIIPARAGFTPPS